MTFWFWRVWVFNFGKWYLMLVRGPHCTYAGLTDNSAQYESWPHGQEPIAGLVFQDFHLVSIRIGDKGHF